MGYQVVDVVTNDYRTKRGVVYNAELLALDEEAQNNRLILLTKSANDALRAASASTGRFLKFSIVRDQRTTVLSLRAAKAATGGASGAAEELTIAGKVFMRFSAFEDDHRVTSEKSLLPGTYATTEEDSKNVKTGKEAVTRYALPSDEPASYRFTIRPEKETKIQKGIVQPANGQPGGGVEVIFTDGTQKNTVTLPPTKLPDE
jgi:hypothetical protein